MILHNAKKNISVGFQEEHKKKKTEQFPPSTFNILFLKNSLYSDLLFFTPNLHLMRKWAVIHAFRHLVVFFIDELRR